VIAVVAVLTLVYSAACSQTPTAPTAAPPPVVTPPPPPPQVAGAPTLACPGPVFASTTAAAGATVTYATPAPEGGQTPVTATCTPASAGLFPIGETKVECTAKDALDRSASCAFPIVVSRLAQLSKTRFLAFGDSLTAGEVTFPVGTTALGAPSFKLVVVPSAAYPTVLAKQLQATYKSQEDLITVANYGVGGERAAVARDRFIAALGVVRPDAVLLLEGANDIGFGENGAASTAAREVRTMAAEARSRGMRVFIATLPPARAGGNRALQQFLLDDYNGRMRDVARSEGAILVDIYQALATNVTAYIGVDGLHPNEVGYAKMAETFYGAIRAEFDVR